MEVIKSKENRIIKFATNAINNKKFRDENDVFVIEGIKMVNEIPESYEIKNVIVSEDFYKSIERITQRSIKNALESILCVCSNQLFKAFSTMTTPEGIIAVVSKRKCDFEEIIKDENVNKVILLDDIRDPGNLGTIIRSADAMGMDMIVTSAESVDLYSPKVARATMGSMFHLPIINKINLANTIETLKNSGFLIYAASLKASKTMDKVLEKSGKYAIVIGNEAHGVSDEIINISDDSFIIEMKGNTESLNASIAASIIMYELSKI